jgi:hypothetical protein
MPQIWHPLSALSYSSSQAEKRCTLLQTYTVDERSAPAPGGGESRVISHRPLRAEGAGDTERTFAHELSDQVLPARPQAGTRPGFLPRVGQAP